MAMISKVRRLILWTWQGCGYLKGYGYHPGTGIMVSMLFFGMLAGAEKGFSRAFTGLAVMALAFGPLYLFGAYRRAKDFYSAESEVE